MPSIIDTLVFENILLNPRQFQLISIATYIHASDTTRPTHVKQIIDQEAVLNL